MATGQRSPLGELVFRYRSQKNLTQLGLAVQADIPSSTGERLHLSERSVSSIEGLFAPGEGPRRSRQSTIDALAVGLELKPGTPAHEAFLRAAEATIGWIASESIPSRSTEWPAPAWPGPRAVFVPEGRELHLTHLENAIHAAINGTPGVVFVSADSGTGKTSLITRACRQAISQTPNLTVLWGECTGSSGAADPHLPFRQILGVMMGDTSAAGPQQLLSSDNKERITDRAAEAIEALIDEGQGLINRFVPAEGLRTVSEAGSLPEAMAERLATVLDTSMGLPGHALGINEQIFRVLKRYAGAGPTIMVLEDLHWADVGTVSILFHIMRGLQQLHLPLLVIGSYRPSDLEPSMPGERHPLPRVLNEAPRLFNGALLDLSNAVGGAPGRAFVDAMVNELVPDAPASLRDVLFEQTAGWPMLVTGMLRWFQAERIGNRGGRTAPRWVPDPARVPTEINVLFSGLLGRLPDDLLPLLKAASVQGTTFSAEVVMRVMGLSHPTLIEKLDAQLLRRYRTLEQGGTVIIAGRPSHEFRFVHAMLRDHVYFQMMSDLERTHYHAATADAMQVEFGTEPHSGSGAIAYHYDKSYEREKAAAAYLDAGGYAMDYQDYDQATIQFARIGELDLRRTAPFSVAQALVGLGNCARGLGDTLLAAHYFEHAHDLADREDLPLVKANSLTSMGMLDYDAGRMRDGVDKVGTAVDFLIAEGDLNEACRSLALLSHMLHGMAHYDEAAKTAQRAIAMATELRNDMFLVGGMIALANCWIDLGFYADAIAIYEKGLVLCEEHGNLHRAVLCWLNISLCEVEQAAWERSIAALAPVFAAKNRINRRLLGAAEFNAGLVAEGRGDLRGAWDRYRSSLEIRLDVGQEALVMDSLAGMLRLQVATGTGSGIRRLANRIRRRMALRGGDGLDGVEHYGRLFVSMVRAYQALGEQTCARDLARQGETLLQNRAALLGDSGQRTSYLTSPPAHRQLIALAQAMAGAD